MEQADLLLPDDYSDFVRLHDLYYLSLFTPVQTVQYNVCRISSNAMVTIFLHIRSFCGKYSLMNLKIVANSNSCHDNSFFYFIN